MNKQFHIDIITPTKVESFDNVEYIRIPSLDGLIGIQARHAQAIIGLDVGEIKITKNGKNYFYATSGGFADIAKEGVQLLLETAEEASLLNSQRAEESLHRGKKRLRDTAIDLNRAQKAIKRAANRIQIIKKFNQNK
jgi:F-type H+-transporting ATPase subunit epsilon